MSTDRLPSLGLAEPAEQLGDAHPTETAEADAACRTVAGHAHDAEDLALLLDALGISLSAPSAAKPVPAPDGHGTRRDYQRHLRKGSTPCEPCREANRRKPQRRLRGATRTRPLRPIEHGTLRGYRQHWYRREIACDDCLRAVSEDSRRRQAARRVAGGAQ